MNVSRVTKKAGRNEYHSYRVDDDSGQLVAQGLVGCTTVLGILAKPALPIWSAREAGKAIGGQLQAVLNHSLGPASNPTEAYLGYISEEIERIANEAIKDGYKYAQEITEKAGQRGTDSHAIAELVAIAYKDGASLSDEFLADILRKHDLASDDVYLVALAVRDWFLRVRPKVIATEKMVACTKCGYGTTLDLLCTIDGNEYLIDLKSGKGTYDSEALQLVAQNHALYGHPYEGSSMMTFWATRHGLLWANVNAKDGCELIETRNDQEMLDTWFSTLKLYKWRKSNSWKVKA